MNTEQTLTAETDINDEVLEHIMGWRVVQYTPTYSDPVWGDASGLMLPFFPATELKAAVKAFRHFLARFPNVRDVQMTFCYLEDERIVCRLSSNLWTVESDAHSSEALALCSALLMADRHHKALPRRSKEHLAE